MEDTEAFPAAVDELLGSIYKAVYSSIDYPYILTKKGDNLDLCKLTIELVAHEALNERLLSKKKADH